MYDSNVEVVLHHGGKFVNNGSLKYVGETDTLSCDLERWIHFEILTILEEMDYVN